MPADVPADSSASQPVQAGEVNAPATPSQPLPPENLPPVEPPSAGFIVQLFVVPGLIVAAIIGVWVMFGRIAEGRQDWRELVAELPSGNEQRRWRAALGLAQMLKADQAATTDSEDRLSRNPEVARSLVVLLDEQLQSRSKQKDDLKQQAFLARTLGFLDVPATVVPALLRALDTQYDVEVRQNSLESLAVIAGRAAEQDGDGDNVLPGPDRDPRPGRHLRQILEVDGLINQVVTASRDSDPLIAQLGTYTLGLLPVPESVQRLQVILSNTTGSKRMRRNAAIGLARMGNAAGVKVFAEVLTEAATEQGVQVDVEPKRKDETDAQYEARQQLGRRNEQFITVKNTLRAVDRLQTVLTAADRELLTPLLEGVAERSSESELRIDARKLLLELQSGGQEAGSATGAAGAAAEG